MPSGNNNSNTNSPNTDTNIIDVREIENPRISIAGSSVTWGSGGKIDDDSYPGYVVDALRKNYAVTILPDKLNSNVVPVPYGGTEPYTYGRSLYKFSGKGVELSGTISGKKLYIVLARERDNTHAALVDVYIDNELVKTFSTKNDTPYFRNKQFSAVADGEQRSWDLGSAHTFNHIVRLNGNVNEKGKINDLGYDAKWPVGYDWLIFRKVTGNEVHHFISFQDPPAQGTKIDVAYDSGENIKPVKSTSDNTEKFLGTKIESLYGDRTTKDLTQPLHFEEGVDFRETDDRAVEVVDMGNDTAHSFRLVVKSVDPVAKDSTPELYLNYITNRMFYIQNASIGGFTAKDFLKTTGTTNIDNINAFNPDLVILESATNDDWDDNEWLAWKDVYMSADEVRNKITSAINLQKLQKTGDKYKVGITHINIKSYTSKSVTLDPDATYSNDIKDGDILVIGDFKGDNRRLAVRLISRWDNKTKTAYFNKDLHTEDFVGNVCQIKRIDKWVENVKEFVRRAREYNSNVEIGIITG
ncbi:MAG TPA: hypothetical protein ENK99_05260, partial [Campylobacterales bacterium]|nr:hypothetical protein [Campylobacterales bacterium]